ncbi:uncharacterized protein CC84DRAFT_1161766 [Paraphaeosphaeria sporulosa]|uniref:Uncharacterized protein n=1 Tax=Paraphaeosphaeria sporulosa TaxID=1460663 RepID=A0A177CVP0_9PLEO|nr:uncharacterized protein CC84DRAFT_1161766 [Paraphaeosphaeria sporulosa]OAG10962.1 hypothetical protein CC84DRAFT_1161766 [Paraphaeosphaeria sporulosa]
MVVQPSGNLNSAWLRLVALQDSAGRPIGRPSPLRHTNAANVGFRVRLQRRRWRRSSNPGYHGHGGRRFGKAVTGGFWASNRASPATET